MIRRLFLVVVSLLLVSGCFASKTSSDEWKQYARGSYLQGVADGKAEVLCVPSDRRSVALEQKCNEAAREAAAIKEVAPNADYELTNNKPERQRTLMRYIELGSRNAK